MATNAIERRDSLAPGTVLRDYTIESVIGHGGFGIVYRARHDELGIVVAIKEYLPIELAVREGTAVRSRSDADSQGYEEGLKRFREEARSLIQFHSHPCIVSCREYFRSNGTAYLVMEFVDGQSLAQVLASREAEGAPFVESDLLAVMVPLLEGLDDVHSAWILHRDIKPSNILIRGRDERPVLIDFGAAKQLVANRSKSMAPFTEGYAALEQIAEAGELGPWTDIYGVGAVMWRMVAGGARPWEPPNPVSVESRSHAFVRGSSDPMPLATEMGKGRFSSKVLEVIDRCLRLRETERLQGCKELLGMLSPVVARPVEAVGAKPASRNPERIPASVPDEAGSGEVAAVPDEGTESSTGASLASRLKRAFTEELPESKDALSLASFARRLGAAAVDAGAIVPVIHGAWVVLDGDRAALLPAIGIGMMAYDIALWTTKSTTVGGLAARIRVVRTDGEPLQFEDALKRGLAITFFLGMGFLVATSALYLSGSDTLSSVVFAVVGSLGWLWALWDTKKQALHDKTANTYVIRSHTPLDVFIRKASGQNEPLSYRQNLSALESLSHAQKRLSIRRTYIYLTQALARLLFPGALFGTQVARLRALSERLVGVDHRMRASRLR